MKEALHYKKLDTKKIQCCLCPHMCVVLPGSYGFCKARKNIDGAFYSMVYGNPVSTAIDPIEKKPLFHFMPNSNILSIGTAGCNFRCLHCQNWEISQANPEQLPTQDISPNKIIEMALENNCNSIAFTYNEPTIAFEYCYEIAGLAKENDLKTVMVTNGYINKKPLEQIYKFIDAANVDLKGFSEKFYKEECSAKLKPVLETIKSLKEMKVWVELTTLIIPSLNDSAEEIKKMCNWIIENLGEDVPLHFSRFFPMYKQQGLPKTPEEKLLEARSIAQDAGLKFVYIGNLWAGNEENTYCPKCKKLVIGRSGFGVVANNIRHGKCSSCSQDLSGEWE